MGCAFEAPYSSSSSCLTSWGVSLVALLETREVKAAQRQYGWSLAGGGNVGFALVRSGCEKIPFTDMLEPQSPVRDHFGPGGIESTPSVSTFGDMGNPLWTTLGATASA